MSPTYLHYSKAPQNVLMFIVHLRKWSARWIIYEKAIYIESAPEFQMTLQSAVVSPEFDTTGAKSQPVECDCYVTVLEGQVAGR